MLRHSKSVNNIILIGAGPSNLACAYFLKLNQPHLKVTIVEKRKSIGRKLLIAGDGGLNLTHNESVEKFVSKYEPSSVRRFVMAFNNHEIQAWLKRLGVDLFVGSSQRVFPEKKWKPIDFVNHIKDHLEKLGVSFLLNTSVDEILDNTVLTSEGVALKFDQLVVATGTPAWESGFKPPTFLGEKLLLNYVANNAKVFIKQHNFIHGLEGEVLKYVELNFKGLQWTGDINIGLKSLESTPIYAMCNAYRNDEGKEQEFFIDLLPQQNINDLNAFLKSSKNRNEFFNKIKLGKVKKALIKQSLSKADFLNDELLVKAIKRFRMEISHFDEVEHAISASGGISLCDLNTDLSHKKASHIYFAGEMLDWNAPTGGYLLSMCFAMGKGIADVIYRKLE